MNGLETIAVVGASLAGVRSVQALRREGFGGRIVLVGAEQHWPPFDRPPLSKQVLTGDWPADKARLRVGEVFHAELVLGRRAVSLDIAAGEVRLDDESVLAFDGLVVATGASPRILPGAQPMDGVHVLRTVDDALALRIDLQSATRVAVIGAGFIGSEVASSCRALGLDVTLIEALDLPLARILGPAMGEVAAALHRAHGVTLRLAVGVRSVVAGADARVEALTMSDGTSVSADVVVVGIGVTPTTGWLEGSGLVLDDGVVCDEACVAVGSDGRAVAAGDVARWHNPLFDQSMRVEHWTNASDQAAHAARALLRGAREAGAFAPVPYFWSDQHGTKLQFVGTSAATDDVVVVEGSIDDGKFVAGYGRDGVTVGALCVNWPARMVPWSRAIAEQTPAFSVDV
ncbi:MAG TPA: FAD-dependent oxidoreductase [Acidimicrobiales bacterium]|nr:FAD-dependent oxidoreductase [Acidimicrobiales bacterium]